MSETVKKGFDKVLFEKRTKYDFEKQLKRKRFNRQNKRCKKGRIVLLGDSITEFFDEHLLDGKSNLEIYNRGISGDTSNRLLERLEENVLSIEPSQIFLLIGTNDFDNGADVGYVFDNIKETVKRIKTALPECDTVLECIYPVNPNYYGCEPTRNEYVGMTNEKIREYAKNNGVTLLDLTELLSDGDGYLSKEYSDDGLHPNEAGNRAIADEISKMLINK